MKCKYSARDLNQRLGDSIIRYKGIPYWVDVDGARLMLTNLVTKTNDFIVNSKDVDLDISTIPLGYINYVNKSTKENRVYYCSRKPLRLYKQGVDRRTLKVTNLENENEVNSDLKNALMFSQGFVDMVVGQFPFKTIMDAVHHLNKSEKEEEEVAFSREIALKRTKLQTINVYFRDEIVGYLAANSNILQVPSNEKGWIVSRYMNGLGWIVN